MGGDIQRERVIVRVEKKTKYRKTVDVVTRGKYYYDESAADHYFADVEGF